ncbi:MAG: radical SAM protein [Thermoguttaceae bacterium]
MNSNHGAGARRVYLRLSVTDRCNLRCRYCRPAESFPAADDVPAASDEELLGLIEVLSRQCCLYKLRLTGGEPLLHSRLPALVRQLRRRLPNTILCLTTNGLLLAEQAADLRAAGLDAINVSLDAIDSSGFAAVTGGGRLGATLAGIRAARGAGFAPLKINTVLIRRYNGHCLAGLVRLAAREQCEIRFIELMPCGSGARLFASDFLSAAEALTRLSESLVDLGPEPASATARRRRLLVDGRATRVGFITAVSSPFCEQCDRLRLDSRGRLVSCLRSPQYVDLLTPWRAGDVEGTAERLRECLDRKGPPDSTWPRRAMVAIGG